MLNFIEPLAVFVGTIVGAGIFGLPYLALRVGFGALIFIFLALTVLVIVIHRLFAEIVCGTPKTCRLPGYVEEYLGKKWRNFSFVVSFLGLLGALLAYLILGGEFLRLYFVSLFGGPTIIFVLIYFAAGAFLIRRGIKSVSKTELVMTIGFVLLIFLFLCRGWSYIRWDNLTTFNVPLMFLPYGAILFSLWGLALVPEIAEMNGKNFRAVSRIIGWGVILAALCYLFFVFIILSVSGSKTSSDALSGFFAVAGEQAIRLGYLFGLLTTFTSFIALGLTLKNTFRYDLRLSENISWFLACFPALGLYLLGLKNFIGIISLTGAVMLGLEAALVIFVYRSFLARQFRQKAPFWIYPVLVLLLSGAVLQIVLLIF